MGRIVLGTILLVGFYLTSFESQAQDATTEQIHDVSGDVDSAKTTPPPELLLQNFERVGGNSLAFRQAQCFLEKYQSKTFVEQNDDKGIKIRNKNFVVISDLTIPSDRPRLFLINLQTKEVRAYMVAHGLGLPGSEVTLYEQSQIDQKDLPFILLPKKISNTPGSKATSRGSFILDETYHGSFGYSLRLHGIQKNINDNVLKRLVVMHGFKGMNPFSISSSDVDQKPVPQGNLATSQGCSMLEPSRAKEVIDSAKDGSFYYIFTEYEKQEGSLYCADENIQLK